MPQEARDNTEDWLLPPHSVPPTMAELAERVDIALSLARASEAAVMTAADAAIESAGQALRAAELAERAAASAARGAVPPAPAPPEPAPPEPVLPEPAPPEPAPIESPPTAEYRRPSRDADEEWLISFTRRAEHLTARFAELR